jgi:hypothetical protein
LSTSGLAEERNNATGYADEDILTYTVSDEAIEAVGIGGGAVVTMPYRIC